MRSLHQRLFAVLIGFVLAMLVRPGELQARGGRTAVEKQDAQQLAMQSPRRSTLGLPRAHVDVDAGAKVAHAVDGELPALFRIVAASQRVVSCPVGERGIDRELRLRRLRTRGPPAL
ncbi:MAG TPA: hypothetical protein VG755_03805 [Nannocystaceae bacterium]|nr:hypothetical protein [Nannocystaceae bacterium]